MKMYEAPSLDEWNEVRWNGILTTWGVFNEICCKTNEKWYSLTSYLRKKMERIKECFMNGRFDLVTPSMSGC